jgi:transposase
MSHRNARLKAHGRKLLCERVESGGWKLCEAAAAAGVSRQTAGKWLARWRAEGAAGLLDRSSRPLRIALRVVGRLLRRVVLLRLKAAAKAREQQQLPLSVSRGRTSTP